MSELWVFLLLPCNGSREFIILVVGKGMSCTFGRGGQPLSPCRKGVAGWKGHWGREEGSPLGGKQGSGEWVVVGSGE